MEAWKWLGLAGIAGVTAGGVAVARSERKRRSYTPDEIRDRLLERANSAVDRAEVESENADERT